MSVFLDTNILLYSISNAPDESRKRAIAEICLKMDGIAISVQVLAEFYRNAVNPKNGKSLSKSDARDLVAAWKRHKVINNSVEVLNAALDIAAQTNFQIFDCLIIAAAKVAGCSLLLSEDMHDGQTVGGVRIENPFRAS